MLRISLNTITFSLLCCYAVLISLEHVLEVFMGIRTVLKPYRFVAILLIGVSLTGLVTKKVRVNRDLKQDVFLYLIFLYGLTVTLFQIVLAPFNLSKFYNEIFQIFLYLAVFFIYKNFDINETQWRYLIWSFLFGLMLNALYICYEFYIMRNYIRLSGLMDNPNYVALAIVVAISYLIFYLGRNPGQMPILLGIGLTLLLLRVFVIAGSRTGLIVSAIAFLLLLWFGSAMKKSLLLLVLLLGLINFIPTMLQQQTVSEQNVLVTRLNTEQTSDDPRFALWQGAYLAAQSSDYLGLGMGQFEARFAEFYDNTNNYLINKAKNFGGALGIHSDYLGILVEYGIFGLVCYLLFLGSSLWKIRTNIRFAPDLEMRKIYQFHFIILVAVMIFGITNENFLSPLYWFLIAFSTKTLA